ncbi:ABC transporter permease [Arthrobacter sp. AFG7.2]|uniref:ABC transporter permease n=1 Tax=Arthrobacter sp. AFG7.2 TaxID=1688693 RepID=UPI000C9E5BCF|nr:ABC transporter permease [Arthrobacter sp. AFG7.2]PNI09469.1 ABC transporter permease [Arthrobacter sp. AFG7.2]
MSAAVLPVRPGIPADSRLRFSGILRSEWIKLTSLRSTLWSLLTIILVGIGLSFVLALTMESAGVPDEPSVRFTLSIVAIGAACGQFVAAVLGVLAISGEYSTKMVQSTLAAVPSRLPVLAAKAMVLLGLVTAVGLVTLFGSWAATYAMFDDLGLAVSLAEPGLAGALLGAALFLGLTATFALGVGAILRSAAGGVAAVLGVLLLLPLALSLLGNSMEWVAAVTPYGFAAAGESMWSIPAGPAAGSPVPGTPLTPGAGGLVVLAWTTMSLVLGALTLRGRDA